MPGSVANRWSAMKPISLTRYLIEEQRAGRELRRWLRALLCRRGTDSGRPDQREDERRKPEQES